MIKTEYKIVRSHKSVCLAIVADLHERQPDEVLSILSSVYPDYILVPGDLLECHNDAENLDRADDNAFSRFVCRGIHGFDYFVAKHPQLFVKRESEACKDNVWRFLREASKIAPLIMSICTMIIGYTLQRMKLHKMLCL